jgi:hypothetical protein
MAKKTCYRCGATSDLEDVKEGKSFVNVCKDKDKCMRRKLKSSNKISIQGALGV